MSGALKKSTNLTGLAVSVSPRVELRVLYERILRLVNQMPQDYIYRKSIESLIKERTDIISQNESVPAIEEKINQGQIEELIIHAKNELNLVQNMFEYKPWESLMEKAPLHQWTWPPHK
ncbi:NADH dehydrogenase (ubiquinone) subunit ND-13B [Bombus vancouverensis nearcticus]|uniref:NADH dehydrogenase (ubiquinone) subunit ND-13B n=1 Tax=Bombus vancouverensis nearcticus TaxID=2705178 RepID=UPI0014395CC5|nr:NADH dehydrogenase [ubiquinone] 1 alpha subcomplex subunit 5 [Bombus vancouverensis nearcticus]